MSRLRFFSRRLRHDDGVALPMVLLVFILSVLLITAFLVAIVGSSQVTLTTRAGIQAQAAAEAGIEDALSQIGDGDPCDVSGGDSPNLTPDYSVTVVCDASRTAVTIESTGRDTSGGEEKVQAIFTVHQELPPIDRGGPGLFYTSGLTNNFSNYVFDAARSEISPEENLAASSVYASSGNFNCWNKSEYFPGHIYTGTGNITLGGCTVQGSVYAGGNFTLQGSSVVHGSVFAAGTGTNTLGTGSIKGNFKYRGGLSTWGTPLVGGEVTRDPAVTPDSLPTIPIWQNVSFDPVNATTPPKAWADQNFTLVTVPSSECKRWNGDHLQEPIWPTLSSITTPTVFDVRACDEINTEKLSKSPPKVDLKANIAIVLNKATLANMTFTSAAEQTLWFISPDNSMPGPQCSGRLGTLMIKGNSFGDRVAAYLYTPCKVDFDVFGDWRGQVYSGSLALNGGVKIAFAPRNIPGYDFSDGAADGDDSGTLEPTIELGDLIVKRNIDE